MTVETSKTVEITHSYLKGAGLALGALAFVAIGVWLILNPPSIVGALVGMAATGFFGFVFVVILWRFFGSSGPVISISPSGLFDARICAQEIPWKVVRKISTWSHSGTSIIVVKVDAEAEENLPLTRAAKSTRGVNERLGVDGLCIAATGLNVSYQNLLKFITAYAGAYALEATVVES